MLEPYKKYRLRMLFMRYATSVWVNDKVACMNVPRVGRQVEVRVQPGYGLAGFGLGSALGFSRAS